MEDIDKQKMIIWNSVRIKTTNTKKYLLSKSCKKKHMYKNEILSNVFVSHTIFVNQFV